MIVDPGVESYIDAHTTPAAEHLQRLDAETRASLSSPQMLSGPVVGRLLQAFVSALQARLVVEVGTYSGYSALMMAEALPPGSTSPPSSPR